MSELAVSASNVRPTEPENDKADASELFVRTFNEVRTELVNTLYFILGNREEAQDVAQDAFLKCWRTRESFVDIQNVRAWIFRVGINAAKDLQRNAYRRKSRPLDDTAQPAERPGSISVHEGLEKKETLERIRQALHELRAEEKEVFLLRQNGDMTYEEIAELRRVPLGTVKTQMRSALQKLRRVLKDS